MEDTSSSWTRRSCATSPIRDKPKPHLNGFPEKRLQPSRQSAPLSFPHGSVSQIPPFYSPSVFGLCPSNGLRPLPFPLCLNASQKYPYLFGRFTYIKIENNHRLLGQLSKDTFGRHLNITGKVPNRALDMLSVGHFSEST